MEEVYNKYIKLSCLPIQPNDETDWHSKYIELISFKKNYHEAQKVNKFSFFDDHAEINDYIQAPIDDKNYE